MVQFSLEELSKILDFSTNCEKVHKEESNINDVISEISRRKVGMWPSKSRVPASLPIVEYHILFRLGIFNWFLTAHNSSF